MKRAWNSERKMATGFGVVLAILIVNALISAACIRNLTANSLWVLRSRVILNEVDELQAGLKDAGFSMQGYVLTAKPVYVRNFHEATGTVDKHIDRLRYLCRDNLDQLVELNAIENAVNRWLAVLEDTIKFRDQQGFEAARDKIHAARELPVLNNARRESAISKRSNMSCSIDGWTRPAGTSTGASPASRSRPFWRCST